MQKDVLDVRTRFVHRWTLVAVAVVVAAVAVVGGLSFAAAGALAIPGPPMRFFRAGAHLFVCLGLTWAVLIHPYRRLRRQLAETRSELEERNVELSAVFSHAPVIMFLVDEKGRVRKANRLLGAFNGLPEEQLVGMRGGEVLRCFHALDDPQGCGHGEFCRSCAIRKIVKDTFENAAHYHRSEALLPLRTGETSTDLWFLVSTYLVQLTGRRLVLVCLEDVTERKEFERGLRESEERYRELVEHQGEGIGIVDAQENVTFANPAADRIFGVEPTGLVGRNLRAFLDDAAYDSVRRETGKRQHGESSTYEVEIRRADGHKRYLLVTATPRYRDGHFVGTFGVFRDITDRKHSEAERERLMSAVEQAAEAIMITDTVGLIQYVNPAFERITGYSPEEAIGRNPSILKSGRHDAHFYRSMWNTLSKGEVWTGRIVNRKKDGRLYTEEAVISPVRDETGRSVNYVAVKRDISSELHLEEQLRQAQKMEAVGQLAGGVAHDFNNLLQVIIGYGDVALDAGPAENHVRSAIAEMLDAADRARVLVGRLLAFSRRQVLEMKNLDLNDVVVDLMKMLRRLIGEHISLNFLGGNGVRVIRGDPAQIDQILTNLLVNARDAMPDGGTVTIETRNVSIDETWCESRPWAELGEYVLLSVRDTGCGMDEATQERLFEPFYTTKEVGKGSGLGLSMIYGLVKQHGGVIDVTSTVGEGSVFDIYFPSVDAVPTVAGLEPVREPTGGNERILLAEDEAAVRSLTRTVLERAGYSVLAANDGGEALELFTTNQGQFDLVILDVVMPTLNGHEVYDRIKRSCPSISVLYMSGYSMDMVDENFVLGDDDALLRKPFQREQLLRAVRNILDG